MVRVETFNIIRILIDTEHSYTSTIESFSSVFSLSDLPPIVLAASLSVVSTKDEVILLKFFEDFPNSFLNEQIFRSLKILSMDELHKFIEHFSIDRKLIDTVTADPTNGHLFEFSKYLNDHKENLPILNNNDMWEKFVTGTLNPHLEIRDKFYGGPKPQHDEKDDSDAEGFVSGMEVPDDSNDSFGSDDSDDSDEFNFGDKKNNFKFSSSESDSSSSESSEDNVDLSDDDEDPGSRTISSIPPPPPGSLD